jgi:hypothetical protein
MNHSLSKLLSFAGSMILATGMLGTAPAYSQDSRPECEMLFVQDARDIEMTADALTLKGADPLITFFCDRPVRHAGHLTNEEYLQSWDHAMGQESFEADPPNAMISMLDGEMAHDVVVELLDKPTVNGEDFVYKIFILQGEAFTQKGPGTLFIDIIGRPFTPLSVAGVGRREVRRTVRRCAAGVTCW